MNIQSLVNQAHKALLPTLGAEVVTINGTDVSMVLAESDEGEDIMGGTRIEKRLVGMFPSDVLIIIRPNDVAETRGSTWKVESLRTGQAMTELTLQSANKVKSR
jgi:hypothetical protein